MREIRTTRGELVFALVIAFLLGSVIRSCTQPARADDIPGIGYSANRIACAVEKIQHLLEEQNARRK